MGQSFSVAFMTSLLQLSQSRTQPPHWHRYGSLRLSGKIVIVAEIPSISLWADLWMGWLDMCCSGCWPHWFWQKFFSLEKGHNMSRPIRCSNLINFLVCLNRIPVTECPLPPPTRQAFHPHLFPTQWLRVSLLGLLLMIWISARNPGTSFLLTLIKSEITLFVQA